MAKHAGGRPTKYRKEFCDLIVERAYKKIKQPEGSIKIVDKSLTDFASFLGVDDETLLEWAKKYPEFSDSKKIANQKYKQFLLDYGHMGAVQNKATAWWMFLLKCNHGFNDRKAELDQMASYDVSFDLKNEDE